MKRMIWVLVVVATISVQVVQADENNWKLSGYHYWLWIEKEGADASFVASQTGILICGKAGTGQVVCLLTPKGTPCLFFNLQISWEQPFKDIDYIVLGRERPPFGWEARRYRVDLVPTVYYSAISRPLVARDNGIEIGWHTGQLCWTAGLFVGHGVGGNVPSDDFHGHTYLRLRYPIKPNLWLGVSQRFGPVPARGADIVWENGRLHLAGELINTKGVSEWYLLGTYHLGSTLSLVSRYEHLQADRRWTAGINYQIGAHEVRVNAITSENSPDQVVGQFVIRF